MTLLEMFSVFKEVVRRAKVLYVKKKVWFVNWFIFKNKKITKKCK